jgi:hypothetical protein
MIFPLSAENRFMQIGRHDRILQRGRVPHRIDRRLTIGGDWSAGKQSSPEVKRSRLVLLR